MKEDKLNENISKTNSLIELFINVSELCTLKKEEWKERKLNFTLPART